MKKQNRRFFAYEYEGEITSNIVDFIFFSSIAHRELWLLEGIDKKLHRVKCTKASLRAKMFKSGMGDLDYILKKTSEK